MFLFRRELKKDSVQPDSVLTPQTVMHNLDDNNAHANDEVRPIFTEESWRDILSCRPGSDHVIMVIHFLFRSGMNSLTNLTPL